MKWYNITAATRKSRCDEVERLFWSLGALSVTVADGSDDPIFEPGYGETPLWCDIHMTSLFPDSVDISEVDSELRGNSYTVVDHEVLFDRVWEREWLKYFRPTRFGRRLWICPSGTDIPDVGAVTMKLDPGLAFGTGSHSTTRLCLEWLSEARLRGVSLLDFGCGSGVLGIAASLLGARDVTAIDNDPQAIVATQKNAENNRVRAISAVLNNKPVGQFDIVIANILSAPLIDLSVQLKRAVFQGGSLVLSGIMDTQLSEVLAAYSTFTLCDTQSHDGWVLLHLKNLEREL